MGTVPVREVETRSEEETRQVGKQLATVLPEAAVVSLIGELGAGKTTLTKGIVEGRGAATPDEVSSPTFTLIHEYGEPPAVYHIDLYRLDTPEEAARLGLDELFARRALVLIEWGERFPQILPADRWHVRITRLDDDRRRIEVDGPGR